MNQVFNFQRFALLVSKHWVDNKKRYSLSIIAFIGLLFLWFVYQMLFEEKRYHNFGADFQVRTYFISLLLAGSIYASQFFSELGSRSRGINYLLMPASVLEKLLCGLLFGIVLYFVVFTLSFYFVNTTMNFLANIFNANNFESLGLNYTPSKVINVFVRDHDPLNEASLFIRAFLVIQSAFLLGTVYFRRYSFLKTAIALVLIYFFFLSGGAYFSEHILSGRFSVDMQVYHLYTGGIDEIPLPPGGANEVRLPVWHSTMYLSFFRYTVPPILWCATYFSLKEKEI
ncbi:hypothetical protein OCK74_00980 [Chitinophagaceae bacterium LB-8]|uniref:Uncharacterized protein n=1 Tax=Paraflavisolibacter caeni TaxID=2982496 RepID=A0A9X2XSJ1_9BACT|nr:hypothetical protein [Paraflavisolibacter caeni]MCU7547660.1 hypothetical protein [Paraflavisolibacter caeni]